MRILESIINYFKPLPPIDKRKKSFVVKKDSASNAANEALQKFFVK